MVARWVVLRLLLHLIVRLGGCYLIERLNIAVVGIRLVGREDCNLGVDE